MSQDYLDELGDVRVEVAAATETEHATLGEFIRYEVARRADSPLAGIILCAAFPKETGPADRAARISLATAMVLLDVALSLHKLLLLQNPETDSLDKSLVGGTVLAGDYCFSQAAVAAARTGNPRVVAIFSNLLQELSEAHLRHLFENSGKLDEFPRLFRSGGLAGAVLAGLSEGEQERTATFAASVAQLLDPAQAVGSPEPLAEMKRQTPAHQHSRWLALLQEVGVPQ